VAVCPPDVTGGSVADGAAHLTALAEQLPSDTPEQSVSALRKLQGRFRWSAEEVTWGLLRHLADCVVQRELKPGL
jgi:hypothetical protein